MVDKEIDRERTYTARDSESGDTKRERERERGRQR